MLRILFPVVFASASLAAWGAVAQNLLSGPLGACPDATPEESALFKVVPVPEPTIRSVGPLHLAGKNVVLAAHSIASFAQIPPAWDTLTQGLQNHAIGNLIAPQGFAESGPPTELPYLFSACYTDGHDGFNIMPGVAVQTFDAIPDDFTGLTLDGHKYAVFDYTGTLDGIGDFRYSLTTQYWPTAPYQRADAPNLELHLPDSRPPDNVHMEMWVAVED